MFTVIGRVVDRFWPHLLSLGGTVALALFGTVLLEWLTSEAHGWLAITLVVGAALLSAAGTVLAAVRAEKRRQQIEVDLLTAIRATVVPVSIHFIKMERPIDAQRFEDAVTELTLHWSAFVSSDGVDSDANYYRLEGNRLTCVNRRSGVARETFTRSKARSPREREESAVIERLRAKQAALCFDTWSKREQRRLSLAEGKRRYRSFVSIPTVDGRGVVRGMLSVNSSKKGAFGQLHVEYLEEMGRLIMALEDAA